MFCTRGNDSVDITHGDVGEAVSKEELCDGNSCRAGSIYNDAAVFLFPAGYLQGIDDTCEDYDRSAVLIIMKYRNVQKFL